METLTTAAQDDSSGANPSSVKSEDSSPQNDSNRGSPPPNCAICLGTCRNKSFTDSCLHQFCFKCLLTWSRVKTVCPLCKQNFRSIIHNVRSNHQYEEYLVEQRQQSDDSLEPMDFEPFTSNGRRFRYRTTLTLPRQDSLAIQQLLLRHYPMMMEMFPGRAAPAPRRASSASFRRTVYRHDLWARPLPDFTGRFRDCTPQFYRYNDSQMHRLVPWLNRELSYLLNENIGQITCVVSRILELLPRFHMHSTEFREAIQYFLRERTDHFIHELYCFASTPYDMTGYDRNVQYTTSSMSAMENEVISSGDSDDSADSDIVMISSSGPSEAPPGPSRLPAPVYPQNYIPPPPTNNIIPIETISNSDTDDDSSEVMVVGYIKPPAARTPEVVDLVGSDSDVIVQETPCTPPRPQAQTSDSPDARQETPLVELVLKKRDAQQISGSDSEDSAYTPPPPTRRRKRQRSKGSTNSSQASEATHAPTSSQASQQSVTETDPRSYSSSSDDEQEVRRRKDKKRKKYKRKHKDSNSHSDRSKSKRRKPRPCSKPTLKIEKEATCNRKSISGKGVKSSKRKDLPNVVPEENTARSLDEPSTSGINKNYSDNRETNKHANGEARRLRSVVNVVINQSQDGSSTSTSGTSSVDTSSTTSTSSGTTTSGSVTATTSVTQSSPYYSDSDDDLPLNLSMQKWSNAL